MGKQLAHTFKEEHVMQVDSTPSFVKQLNWYSNQSTQALERLASGSRLLAPQDDSAGLAVLTRMEARMRQFDATASNIANGTSYTQTQDGFLEGLQNVLNRMGALAIRAQDTTLSADQHALFQEEFRALKDTFNDLRTAQYNGRALFDGKDLSVTTSPEQHPLIADGVDLFVSDINSVTTKTTHLDTLPDARNASQVVNRASEQIALHRTRVGTTLAGLQSASVRLETQRTSMQTALSRISDAEIATETMNLAKGNIITKMNVLQIKQGIRANSHLSNLLG